MRTAQWRKLPIGLTELCLDTTLRCGQSFRWRKSEDNTWSCALHGRILSFRQDPTILHYRASFPESSLSPLTPPPSSPSSTSGPPDEDNTEALVNHYLNLGPDLTELYEQWSSADTNFKKKAPRFAGVRILKQDAWEALGAFAFFSLVTCQAPRSDAYVVQMEKLCLHYGPLIGHLDSKPYHDMPSPSALTRPGVEAHLRQLGFGYRAKYLYQTALLVTQDHEPGWLDSLRNPESPVIGAKIADAGKMLPGGREGYRTAHAELLTLQGVGPKVADCVCLMGLGWGEAVPVDTHVWQIAQRDYKFGKGKHSSLTKDTYDAVGNKFRSLWGKEAGWSHSVLFTADLRAFSDRLTAKTETVKVKAEVDSEEKAVKETVQRTADVLKPVSVKREFEGEESTLNVYESSTKKSVKRRRKG